MPFSGSCEQEHDSDAMLWHTTRYTSDECVATPAELARQRSTMHPRSLILGLDSNCNACHGGWSPSTFSHRVTGQVLDKNHAEHDCDVCHVERRFDRPPTCDNCHEEEEGITFPAKRPGPPVGGVMGEPDQQQKPREGVVLARDARRQPATWS